MSSYADVILPLPLDNAYTYALPEQIAHLTQVGSRVIVPFGARKFYSAVVVRIHGEKPEYAVKDVLELLDERPAVLPAQMKLWRWIADYYLCTLGEVYKAALPSGMKLESESRVVLCPDFVMEEAMPPSEQRILEALMSKSEQSVAELQRETGLRSILPPVRSLLEKGALLMKEEVRRTYKPKVEVCVRISNHYFDEAEIHGVLDSLRRAPMQERLLLRYIEESHLPAALALRNMAVLKDVSRRELLRAADCPPAALQALQKKGILQQWQKPVGRLSAQALPQQVALSPLSPAQQDACDQIVAQWQHHAVCLLHGVTSSGKTEIYIHLIRQAIDEGRQVLYLLPEIVLTAQLTQRLKRVFGDRLGVYHSRYPDAERVEVYQKMLSDAPYDIIVGVRSSIFLPFQRLGLVIIDEEHENSFKQQDPAPRYHGRNAALVLAAQSGARTLLGTATPSVESYHNALAGKYGLVTLSTRYGDVQLPHIEVVDIKDLRHRKLMKGPFSPQLLSLMRDALSHRRQVILFQNRRGYAPMMECHVCGWVPRCQNCDVSLTIHRSTRALTCHYCGATYPLPAACPNCGNRDLRDRGYGTERIEDDIHDVFPEARVARMDLDTTRTRQSYEQILHDFQTGATDILVGTQMVTKGLDFQHVSVVGILNAGTMLSQPDFRSHERAFQMMAQVAGRAGRRQLQGHVILQAMDVREPIIVQVTGHDYEGMYRAQMEERQLFNYPPHCRLIYVYMKHRDERVLEQLAADASRFMRQIFGDRVLGPDTPPVGRIQQMHIRQILLKVELAAPMAEARQRLRQLQAHLLSLPAYKSAQFYYDVD